MTTVEDILMVKGPDVIVASPTTTVLEAARLMAEDNVGSVIVRDNDGLLGIFTEWIFCDESSLPVKIQTNWS